MKTCLILLIFLASLSTGSIAQVQVTIVSNNYSIFDEHGMLERIVFDKYREKVFMLQNNIKEVVKNEIKRITGQTTRDEVVKIDFPSNGIVSDYQNHIRYSFTMQGSFEFLLTTGDNEKDTKYDTSLKINFEVTVVVPIKQKGIAASIEFLSPQYWITTRGAYYKERTDDILKIISWSENGVDMIPLFKKVFYAMDELRDAFNSYVERKIKRNRDLRKEILLDESDDLEVKIMGESKLVFSHNHSQRGIVKRARRMTIY